MKIRIPPPKSWCYGKRFTRSLRGVFSLVGASFYMRAEYPKCAKVCSSVTEVVFSNPRIRNRKGLPEMTNDHDRAGDFRRASLLTKYRRQDNKTGQIAIVDEVNDANRAPELLTALLVLHRTFVVRFRTAEGVAMIADYIQGIAALDPIDAATNDVVRAAQIIDLDGKANRAGVLEAFSTAVADRRGMQTVNAVLDHFEVLLPELSSAAGIEFIEAHTTAMLDEEFRPDDQHD
ncbi:MAG: hypothetical protein HY898_28500 [Deltaproteobacteria bacterium]|nr:hypothetical protein [Deltaproteobacteria bacterium]